MPSGDRCVLRHGQPLAFCLLGLGQRRCLTLPAPIDDDSCQAVAKENRHRRLRTRLSGPVSRFEDLYGEVPTSMCCGTWSRTRNAQASCDRLEIGDGRVWASVLATVGGSSVPVPQIPCRVGRTSSTSPYRNPISKKSAARCSDIEESSLLAGLALQELHQNGMLRCQTPVHLRRRAVHGVERADARAHAEHARRHADHRCDDKHHGNEDLLA